MKINQILQGDVLEKLKELPDESVDMVITSPPYYGLRNYGVDGQIGLEETFDEFLEKILQITAEVKRVLKKEGTFWLNFGDSYSGQPCGSTEITMANEGYDGVFKRRMIRNDIEERFKGKNYRTSEGKKKRVFSGEFREKCLLMQPERLAIKMIDEQGWILRNKIKWAKQVLIKKENRTIGSVMPSSVKDRFNESGEELYFFVKNKKYYFDLDAVRMKNQVLGITDFRQDDHHLGSGFIRTPELYENSKYNGKFRGKDNAENFNSPRARTQRKSLDERLDNTKNKDTKSNRSYNVKKLLSEVRLGIKPNTGMESNKEKGLPANYLGPTGTDHNDLNNPAGKNLPTVWQIGSEPHNFQRELGVDTDHFAIFPEALVEIPIKAGCPENGIVLDIFGGSGTVGVVAKRLKRNYILIELNPKYIEIANKRLQLQPTPLI